MSLYSLHDVDDIGVKVGDCSSAFPVEAFPPYKKEAERLLYYFTLVSFHFPSSLLYATHVEKKGIHKN